MVLASIAVFVGYVESTAAPTSKNIFSVRKVESFVTVQWWGTNFGRIQNLSVFWLTMVHLVGRITLLADWNLSFKNVLGFYFFPQKTRGLSLCVCVCVHGIAPDVGFYG